MVDDLVAKILDDDIVTSNDNFSNNCNGNSEQYQIGTPLVQDCKSGLAANSYIINASGYHTTCLQNQIPNSSLCVNENDKEYKSICRGLNSLSLNFCMGQQNHDKGISYANGLVNDAQR